MTPQVFEQAGITGAHLVQIAADVDSIEKELAACVGSQIESVESVSKHTLNAGGKRLRPAFLILSARAAGKPFDLQRAIRLGAAVELIHMATLIHDDVIDESDTRRGRPTAASIFGNTASILTGDVLLAKAMKILAEDGDLRVIRAAASMVVEMAEGEARELEVRGNLELSQDDHFAILRMKTAAFVECCCLLGAIIADADETIQNGLAQYGHHLGLSFQVIDDLLDYRGDPKKTGKPFAADFREGCATLPLILFMGSASAENQEWVRQHFGQNMEEPEAAHLRSILDQTAAFAEAEKTAECLLNQALDALNSLPAGVHRDLLAAAGKFVVQRTA